MARNLDPIDDQLGVWGVVSGSVQQRFRNSHMSLRCFSGVDGIALSHPHYTQPALTESLQEKSSRAIGWGIQKGLFSPARTVNFRFWGHRRHSAERICPAALSPE